jgi:hypothetical protein
MKGVVMTCVAVVVGAVVVAMAVGDVGAESHLESWRYIPEKGRQP